MASRKALEAPVEVNKSRPPSVKIQQDRAQTFRRRSFDNLMHIGPAQVSPRPPDPETLLSNPNSKPEEIPSRTEKTYLPEPHPDAVEQFVEMA